MDDAAWEAELVRTGRTERDKNRPRPTAPAKWTSAEVKSLQGALNSFWLAHRPLDSFLSREAEAAEKVREHLSVERHRTHAVLADIRGMRNLYAERYRSSCESVGNALARPTVWGESTQEMVDRFLTSAREADADRAAAEALLLKVLDYGLPPEVLAYDPTARRR